MSTRKWTNFRKLQCNCTVISAHFHHIIRQMLLWTYHGITWVLLIKIHFDKSWEKSLLCLTCCWCVLAGNFLGHTGLDGGLLHIYQQKGLWVIQSLTEQISGSHSQNQSEGFRGGGSVFHLLRPISLCPRSLHFDPNRWHGESLPCTEHALHCQGNHPVAIGH